MSSLLTQIMVAVGIFVAGAAFGIKWHAGQDAIAENQRLEQVRIQAAAHRADERRQSTQVIGALNAQTKRTQAAQVAAAAASDASGRLRDDLADGGVDVHEGVGARDLGEFDLAGKVFDDSANHASEPYYRLTKRP